MIKNIRMIHDLIRDESREGKAGQKSKPDPEVMSCAIVFIMVNY